MPIDLSKEEIDSELDELELRMDRVRVLYEQFFLGIERTPPTQVQKDVVRRIYRLNQIHLKGAAHKFKLQALIQRFNAHKAYWARTVREIEDGTYKRLSFRAKEREKKRAAEGKLTAADHLAIRTVRDTLGDEAAAEAEAKRLAAAQAEAKRRAEAQAELEDAATAFMDQIGGDTESPDRGQNTGGPNEASTAARTEDPEIRGVTSAELIKRAEKLKALQQRIRAPGGAARRAAASGAADRDNGTGAPIKNDDRSIYERLVAAKIRLDENIDKLSFDKVSRSLEKQRNKVRAKHGVERVEFDVVVKDGKAFLKALPIKE